MISKLGTLALVAASLLFACGLALAHHGSVVSYDMKKQITMTGTVTELKWANPHVYIMYEVKDEKGETVLWGAESHPPNMLAHRGWTRNTLKLGDQITIMVFPSRTGQPRGLLGKVELDGKVILDDSGRGSQE